MCRNAGKSFAISLGPANLLRTLGEELEHMSELYAPGCTKYLGLQWRSRVWVDPWKWRKEENVAV